VNQHEKSKGLLINVSLYLLYFLYAQRRIQKARGSWSTSHSISYTFYTRNTVYKKQMAHNQRLVLSLILFTCVVPRIKSEGLPIDVPLYLLYFLHAQCRVQKARGSRSTFDAIWLRDQGAKKIGSLKYFESMASKRKNHRSTSPLILVWSARLFARSKRRSIDTLPDQNQSMFSAWST
jgi:hypothetical protein